MCQTCKIRANILSRIERVSDQLASVSVAQGHTKNGRLQAVTLRRSLDSLAEAFKILDGAGIVPELANVVQGTDVIDGPDCDTDASTRHGLDPDDGTDSPDCAATQVKHTRRVIGFR